MSNVLVLVKTDQTFREKFSLIFPDKNVIYHEDINLDDLNDDLFEKTEVVVGNPDVKDIDRFPNLVWMQMQSNGPDKYLKAMKGSGVVLTNSAGAYGGILSEHMIGFVFVLYKKLHLYRDLQGQCLWKHMGTVKSVAGSVLLIVGLGDTGRAFAAKMKALGCYVIGVRRMVNEKPSYVDELVMADCLDDVLPRADIVTLCLPRTPETDGLFGRRRFSLMKHGAILINGGRGSTVDTEALCDVLESGRLLGAGLDVVDPEPLPPDHRLWKMKNLVLTPHVVNSFTMSETYAAVLDIILDNAERYAEGKPLRNVIDFETGYREPPRGGE
jgi:phosphoglycerate dehydrogenase-like enzyme